MLPAFLYYLTINTNLLYIYFLTCHLSRIQQLYRNRSGNTRPSANAHQFWLVLNKIVILFHSSAWTGLIIIIQVTFCGLYPRLAHSPGLCSFLQHHLIIYDIIIISPTFLVILNTCLYNFMCNSAFPLFSFGTYVLSYMWAYCIQF